MSPFEGYQRINWRTSLLTEVAQMNLSAFPSPNSRLRRSTANILAAHPVGEIFRNLFVSSVLWVFIAITVYTVFSMVLNRQ